MILTGSDIRPSTNVGSAQAYTIDGATATAPWFAVVV